MAWGHDGGGIDLLPAGLSGGWMDGWMDGGLLRMLIAVIAFARWFGFEELGKRRDEEPETQLHGPVDSPHDAAAW